MSKKINVGIASYGMSGKIFHAPLLKADSHFEVVKILERTKNLSRGRFGETVIARSYSELQKDKNIHLVVVNTPDNTHYTYTKEALLAGKHVVVEKPFVQEVEQGEELIALAEKMGLVLTVFQNRRWDNDFLTVKEVLKNKLLGRVVEFESYFERYRNFIQPHTWKEDANTGAGIVYNLGSHLIDQALNLFGKPESVQADIRIVRTDGKVDDFFDIGLYYMGLKVRLKSSYLVREPGPRFIVHGTEGSFIKRGIDPQEAALNDGQLPGSAGWGIDDEALWGMIHTTINGLHIKGKIETLPGNYQDFYTNLYETITQGATLAVKPPEALDVIRMIKAVQQSHSKGSIIAL